MAFLGNQAIYIIYFYRWVASKFKKISIFLVHCQKEADSCNWLASTKNNAGRMKFPSSVCVCVIGATIVAMWVTSCSFPPASRHVVSQELFVVHMRIWFSSFSCGLWVMANSVTVTALYTVDLDCTLHSKTKHCSRMCEPSQCPPVFTSVQFFHIYFTYHIYIFIWSTLSSCYNVNVQERSWIITFVAGPQIVGVVYWLYCMCHFLSGHWGLTVRLAVSMNSHPNAQTSSVLL